jgi:purine nucleosidase
VRAVAPVPLILDVDTGVDDALALLYAVASPEVDLIAVTCVAGNVPLEMVTRNTLAVLEAAGREDVEVAAGADAPLVEVLSPAFEVHGPGGLGNAVVPEPRKALSDRSATTLLIEEIRARPGELLFISTGPLTNVALAIREEPHIPELLGDYAMMAGAFTGTGNTLPRSEANVWFDPEAAAEVFRAFEGQELVPLAIGLDVTERVVLTPDAVERIVEPSPDSPLAHLIADAAAFYIAFEQAARPEVGGCFLHDPLAVAAALDPALVTTKPAHVEIELEGRHTRGQTVADFLRLWRHPLNARYGLTDAADNVRAALTVDEETFLPRFEERLGGLVESRA